MANLFNNDFDIIRGFISANVNNTWDTISPYVDEAEEKTLAILGPETLEMLKDGLEDDTPTDDYLALLKLVRRAQANFTYLLFASDGTMQISDTGFLQVDEGGRKGAYQWQVRDFKKARNERGWEAMHQILRLLMKKRDVYTEWSESDTISEVLAVWLPTLQDFNKYRRIDGFETLWALRPAMLFVQEEIIRENIGEALYLALAEKFIDDDLDTDDKALMHYILPVVAHLSIERASQELNFIFSSNGLRVEGIEANTSANDFNTPVARTDAFNVRQDAAVKGASALKRLRKFLNEKASPTKYAAYFNSELYEAPGTGSTFKNAEGGSFFAV